MIIGAHLRNEARLPDEDVSRFKSARFNGALVMSYHGPMSAARMGCSPVNCVVRLPDSVYERWPSGERYIPSFQDYADECAGCIRNFHAEGYTMFQLSNEDDLTWSSIRIGGRAASAYDWNWFMENVLSSIRKTLRDEGIRDAQLGYTPLSVGAANVWHLASAAYRAECDFIACHCYWQAAGDMRNPALGASYLSALRDAGTRKVYVTECGNSASQETPVPPDVEARMVTQYPLYIKQAQDAGVAGVYFFILGSTPEWAGFDLTEKVCRSIAARGGSAKGPASC